MATTKTPTTNAPTSSIHPTGLNPSEVLFVLFGTDFTADRIMELSLALCYLGLVVWPLIQLIRTHLRVPEAGWTVQKMFFTLTLMSSLTRFVFFILIFFLESVDYHFFVEDFHDYKPAGLVPAFGSLSGLLFFSTYSLLILFWAEIILHAKNQSISSSQQTLRPIFLLANLLIYVAMFVLWILQFFFRNNFLRIAPNVFMASIYFLAALGFVFYGGRLYRMLKQFPIESRGRRSKLKEVGLVSIICTTCFTLRSGLILYSTFTEGTGDIDQNIGFISAFFGVVELLPSMFVLWILRKLPPKREVKQSQQQQQHQQQQNQNAAVAAAQRSGATTSGGKQSDLEGNHFRRKDQSVN